MSKGITCGESVAKKRRTNGVVRCYFIAPDADTQSTGRWGCIRWLGSVRGAWEAVHLARPVLIVGASGDPLCTGEHARFTGVGRWQRPVVTHLARPVVSRRNTLSGYMYRTPVARPVTTVGPSGACVARSTVQSTVGIRRRPFKAGTRGAHRSVGRWAQRPVLSRRSVRRPRSSCFNEGNG